MSGGPATSRPSRASSRPVTSRVRPPDTEELIGRGEPVAANPDYVAWLVSESMLGDAVETGRQLTGHGAMWQNAFARPDPQAAVRTASVWYTSYPTSLINAPAQSFLGTLSDPELWRAFASIGIQGVHTGPLKRAGGITGWEHTPTIDGHFDRISTHIDHAFGSSDEFRVLCATAAAHSGTVIDDVVPGHTGKGADFRLAEFNYGDYPGIYHMVLVDPQDWDLLPEVPEGRDSVNLDVVSERALADAGYIVGPMQRVLFWQPGVKDTNWAATPPVLGVDGVERRWVYLHYFKEGQPSINWIDPSFAGPRLVLGDALHSLTDLGSGGLRLDANGFLGIERRPGFTAWSEDHPLSGAANHLVASMVRKVGGFTFQELNLSMDAIKATADSGPDLSYDFVARPAYHHALLHGDAEFLKIVMRESLRIGIDNGALVHALQNHDELTYELVHFTDTHSDDHFTWHGRSITGGELADIVRAELRAALTGPERPYNHLFTTNGIACTSASVAAAALGVTDLDTIDEDMTERIRRAHVLMAMFNAWQPGVFALSGWDLVGMLPLPLEDVSHLSDDGDTRWINRGAHDLMGVDPSAKQSESGVPRGRALYGTLPEQLIDPDSFVNRLRGVLALRARLGIAEATLLEVPDLEHPGLFAMVMRLPDGAIAAAVLNFSDEPVVETEVMTEYAVPGAEVVDLGNDTVLGEVAEDRAVQVLLGAHDARVLHIG
ncbi:MAG: maltose alpha-D-glucosyltransferase [Frankiales bacterium]|nr:maltose alpha-D-glucosyltransferase [Frankiales bacterium]